MSLNNLVVKAELEFLAPDCDTECVLLYNTRASQNVTNTEEKFPIILIRKYIITFWSKPI